MIPLQTASRHPVTHIVFSPSGSAVAVAQPHYGITILDRSTGRVLAVCAMPHRTSLTSLTFCDNGKYIATSHAKGIEIFDATTGSRVAVNFHARYKWLHLAERAGAAFGMGVHFVGLVWQPEMPHLISFHSRPRPIGRDWMALSPTARFALAPASGYRIKLHEVDSTCDIGQIERSDDADSRDAIVAKFCPLSHRFAINDGRTISVYDTPELAEVASPESPSESHPAGNSVAVAPMPHTLLSPVFTLAPESASEVGSWLPPFALLGDGRGLLVKRPRNRIQWWDAPTGTVVNEWSWRFEWVTCVAASADGLTAVAGGRFGRVLLWDLA